METKSMMIVGVGGQGTLLASKLLGRLLLAKGFDVKVSEVHGMSQRCGSVVTYVRWGEKVYSPIVDAGTADYVVSFELLEAARYADSLRQGGLLLSNTHKIDPMPVVTGAAKYPESLEDKLAGLDIKTDFLDASMLAQEAGSAKCVNLVLLGRLSNYFDFAEEEWLRAIGECVPEKFLELNKKAFQLGRTQKGQRK